MAVAMKQACEAGWIVVVVTSGFEGDVQRWLRHHGLDQYVTAVVGSESVSQGKPDPEPYRVALSRSGCDAAYSIALEDAPKGAASAVAAGLSTFVIGPKPENAGDWPRVKGFINSFEQVAEIILDV